MQGGDAQVIRAHYDENPQLEWDRANEQTIEYILTAKRLLEHIHPGERVLDMGGGPGRYSMLLAKAGCDVALVDLSPGNAAFARGQAQELGLPLHTASGDARDEAAYPEGLFDHILLMGPMYHLAKDEDRRLVMHHAIKHLRPGGKVYIAFITLYAGIGYYLDCCLNGPLDAYLADAAYVDCVAKNRTWEGMAFTHARFDSLEDMHAFCDSLPLKQVCLFGQEGVLGSRIRQVQALDEPQRSTWINLADRLCEREEYLNHSAHILFIGEKV